MTQTSVQQKTESIAERVDAFINLTAKHEPRVQLSILTELLDRATELSVIAAGDEKIIKSGARMFFDFAHLRMPDEPTFLQMLSSTEMEEIVNTAAKQLTNEQISLATIRAISIFCTIVELEPESAVPDVFYQLIKEELTNKIDATPRTPELIQRDTVLRVFQPREWSVDARADLSVVLFRGELLRGGLGPELYGIAYSLRDVEHVLLETGEYVTLPAGALQLAKAEDLTKIPPYLLACAALFFPRLSAALSAEPIAPELFGAFTHLSISKAVKSGDIKSIEDVMDHTAFGPTGPITMAASFSVNDANFDNEISLTVHECANEPRIMSQLNRRTAAGLQVLMRLLPREFSAQGVYLFPLHNTALSITVL